MGEIRGSTSIIEILKRYPNGEAAALMARLAWACAHCSGALDEPLSLAAKRHGNPAGAVVAAFRALANGGPSEAQIGAASDKPDRRPPPDALWRRYAR